MHKINFRSLLLCLFASLLLLPTPLLAKKSAKARAVKDSEWDARGDTCKPDGKCTFTRKETLPGNIPAELQVVSLGAFRPNVEKIFDYAFGEVRRVASLLADDEPSSEVEEVNVNAGKGYVEVSPEFILVLGAAKKSFLWTGGAFDITTTPEIGNFNNIKIKGNRVYLKKEGMKISFKNIIHGYIADLLIRAVYNANLNDALAVVGPTSRSIGQAVTGNWRTSVDDADGRFAKRGMTLDTSNVSVGSMVGGANAPTIDPRFRTPVQPTCRSVTIISRNAAISEALAAGIYILGPEKGMPLIESLQTIKGVIVDNNGIFLKSPGL